MRNVFIAASLFAAAWCGVALGQAAEAGAAGAATRAVVEGGGAGKEAEIAAWEGAWTGAVQVGTKQVRFNVRLKPTEGGWTGFYDQVDDGVENLEVTKIAIDGDSFEMIVHEGNGDPTLKGKRDEKGVVKGKLTQGPVVAGFEMKRGVAERKRRPQEPTAPLPYKEEAASIAVKEGVKLAGTLAIPEGAMPEGGWPAVVMVTAAGPQNRDMLIGGHRSFTVLADRLVRSGIVVLRYDDRGIGESTGNFMGAKITDFAEDADAAVKWLRGRPEVTKSAVGILGHSEGGTAGLLVAEKEKGADFVVMLAAQGVPGRELQIAQLEGVLQMAQASPKEIEAQIEAQGKVFDGVVAGDAEAARAALQAMMLLQGGVRDMSKAPAEMKQKTEAASKAQVPELMRPWTKEFLTLDPREPMEQVKVPVLAMGGTLDTLVFAAQNLPEIERVLKDAGNTDVTIREVEGVNHLFQPAVTGSPAEFGTIEITMSEEVMKEVAEWINSRFAVKK